MNKNLFHSPIFVFALSLFFLFAVWKIAAVTVNSVLIVPAPELVFRRLFELVQTRLFWVQLGITWYRCLCAFLISLGISFVLGPLIARFSAAALFFSLPLTIIKSTPVVSFILLAVFWFSSGTVPVFVSVIMTFPIMTSSVAAGVASVDKKLSEMTQIYGFTSVQKIRHLYIPSLLPYFFSGALASLGLTWKVVVAGEVLTLPAQSVGAALQTARVHLETADVFAWTIAVILLSYLVERLFSLCTSGMRRHL